MRAVGARGPGDLGLTPTAAERRRENLFEPRHPDTKKEASTKLLLINESDRRRTRSGGPRPCADRSGAETRELVRAPSSDIKKEAFTKLPLNESDRRGSNPRSRPWQGRALPTTPLSHLLVCIALYSNFAYTRSHSVLIAKRVMGIEPTYPAWKAGVLPLNYTRAMPGSGIEPETRGFSVLCSTN